MYNIGNGALVRQDDNLGGHGCHVSTVLANSKAKAYRRIFTLCRSALHHGLYLFFRLPMKNSDRPNCATDFPNLLETSGRSQRHQQWAHQRKARHTLQNVVTVLPRFLSSR